MATPEATSVQVAVRIRPLLGKEKIERCSECVQVLSGTELLMMGKEKQFTFDRVFGIESQQEEIYESCVSPLVTSLFDGYNATVLAYGQTGSGKTYTMGTSSEVDDGNKSKLGVIPRAMAQIFDLIDSKKESSPGSEFYLRVQFLEVYGEDIRDLLDPVGATEGKTVSIREDDHGGVAIVGAEEETVNSTDGMLSALERGALCRTTGSTQMNVHSSRSHAIFTIIIEQHVPIPRDEEGEEGVDNEDPVEEDIEYRTAKFHFVDLAGSERAKRTGATGTRLKEGININKGLLALGNVISALGDETKPKGTHVPYRDSKLTRMLQDSLGGNSRTLMIACVSPADANYEETLNALRYANRARNIKNKPVVNRDPNSSQIALLKAQIAQLKMQLRGDGVPGPHPSPFVGTTYTPSGFGSGAVMEEVKSRLRDAEDQLVHVTESLEREKKLRSELQEKYIMATAKVDYYASVGVDQPEEEKLGAIAGYLRTIEELQTQLQSSDHELALMRKSMNAMRSEMAFEESLDDIERELVRNSQIQKELGFANSSDDDDLDTTLEDSIEGEIRSRASDAHTGVSEIPVSSVADNEEKAEQSVANLNSDGLMNVAEDDDEATRVIKERFKKTQESYRNMVKNYDVTLRSKQMIMQKVVEERKKFEAMKQHYEQKLAQMNEEVQETEQQRDALDAKIRGLEKEKSTEANRGLMARLKLQLKEKDERLRTLERQTKQLNEAKRMAAKWQQKEVRIQQDIDRMKKQKVEYQKRMEENAKKYRQEAQERRNEIAQLRKERTRLANQKNKLQAQNTRDERLLKQKTEQVTSMQRKLREAQKLTLHNRKLTEKERKQRKLLEEWSKQQLKKDEELERLHRSLAKKQSAIERKEQLCKELEERKKTAELRAKLAEENAARVIRGNDGGGIPKKQSLRSYFEVVADKDCNLNKDIKSKMTQEELEAMEELENRLDAAESEIMFHNTQCEKLDLNGSSSTDEVQVPSIAGDDPTSALKELMSMYIDEKRHAAKLEAQVERLRKARKSESYRNRLDMHNRRKSLGLASPSSVASPVVINKASSWSETPSVSNGGGTSNGASGEDIASMLLEYKRLTEAFQQHGIDPEKDENLVAHQIGEAKLHELEEQVRQMQVKSSPKSAHHDRDGDENSSRKPVVETIFDRLTNTQFYTGIHKRKVMEQRSKMEERERPVDQLVLVTDVEVDSLTIQDAGNCTPRRSTGSLAGSPGHGAASPKRSSASSPSFTKPTESYVKKVNAEQRDPSKRLSGDRPAFCSTAGPSKSKKSNYPALSESSILEIRNETGTFKQEEGGLYRNLVPGSASRNGRARQAAWESSVPKQATSGGSPKKKGQKAEGFTSPGSDASENSSEKENTEAAESTPSAKPIFEKLSDPKNFTGTQKQKARGSNPGASTPSGAGDSEKTSDQMRKALMAQERARRKNATGRNAK